MAKIFWIAEKDGDYMEMFAFNNKRKAQEKALELAPHFSFGDTEIPKEEDDDFGDNWLYSGTINAKECFILYREGGMPYADGAFVDEAEASRWVEDEGYDTAGACFPVKLKGGMGSVSMSMEPEGNGTQLFLFTDGEVYETKQTIKTMKYVPTFESFIGGSKKLNEKARKWKVDDFLPLGESGDYGLGDGHDEKWGPVLNAMKVDYLDDLVWLGTYFPEIVEEEGKEIKSFELDSLGGSEEDPHGDVSILIYKWKGMLLAEHSDDYQYTGTLCTAEDAVKLAKLLENDEYIDLAEKYVPTFESFLNEASADLRVATPKTKMLIKDCKKIFMKGPKKPDAHGTWHAGADKEPGNNWIESLMRVFKSYGKVKVHKWKDGDQLVQIDIEGQDGSLYVADKLMGHDHYDKKVGEHFTAGRIDTLEHGNGPEFTPGLIYFNLGPSVNESFIGSQKLNEYITLDYSWEEAREGEPTRDDEKKWAPVLKAFKVRKMEDLTWLAEYLPDSDNFDNNSKLVKSFQLKSIRDDQDEWQDPHGNVDFAILEYKGLLIGDHSDEMRYQGALVRTKDVKAWEAIYKEEDSEGYLY